MSDARPSGITALTALLWLLAAAALVYAVLTSFGLVPLSSGAWLLPGGFEQAGPLAFLLYGALCVLLGWGLARRVRWSRGITSFVAIAGVAMVVPGISSAVADSRTFAIVREGLQIIVRVLVVFYLNQQPVKDWFS